MKVISFCQLKTLNELVAGYYLDSLFQNLSGLAVPNFGENVQGCSFYRDSLYRILRVLLLVFNVEDI